MILWQNKIFTINWETKYFAIYSEDLISWVFYTLSDNINTDDLQLKKNLLLAAKPNFRRCCTASASHQSKLWPPANLVFLRISVTPNISYFSRSDILAADQHCMSSARPTSVIIKLVIKIEFYTNCDCDTPPSHWESVQADETSLWRIESVENWRLHLLGIVVVFWGRSNTLMILKVYSSGQVHL